MALALAGALALQRTILTLQGVGGLLRTFSASEASTPVGKGLETQIRLYLEGFYGAPDASERRRDGAHLQRRRGQHAGELDSSLIALC